MSERSEKKKQISHGLSKIYSAQVSLLKAHIISVETDIARGLYQFSVVGLPDKAVEESRDRVSAAIKNPGWTAPNQKNQKITVSLAPAEIKKEGPSFDLPIALSYLLASGDILFDPEQKLFVGELSLSGDVRSVRGILPITQKAKEKGFREIYVPEENAVEAALVEGIRVFGLAHLSDLAAHFSVKKGEKEIEVPISPQPRTKIEYDTHKAKVDMSDIKGQAFSKHGLLIAAAGGHNVGMYGPPGTGKTMLAQAFQGILPRLAEEDVFEVSGIYSIAGLLEEGLVTLPPFRAPHHTASYVSLVGGGTTPRPGEITLAHRGVLFLDEFPEFDKRVIESLRQPLEDGKISIARAKGSATFPAQVMLIAAMNPCPCGFYYSTTKRCVCRPHDLLKYRRKLSGPIVDRIDIWLSVDTVEYKTLSDGGKDGDTSEEMLRKVLRARARQRERFVKEGRRIQTNSEMSARDIVMLIKLSPAVKSILEAGADRLKLSARAYHKIIKLSRTIADLDDKDEIEEAHALAAFQYRPKLEN